MFDKLKEKAEQITRNLSVLYIAYKRKDVPVMAKIIIMAAIVYALSPIDLIPDFIPVLGFLDDILILPALIYVSIKIIPKNILEACKKESEEMTIDGKYKKWYYGIPVLIIWIIIGIIVLKNILRNIPVQ
jgi:uncharacterized membrane protein YkvA (DUF1232 family)